MITNLKTIYENRYKVNKYFGLAKIKSNLFPLDVEIELIAIKGEKVFKKTMKYGDALKIPKKKGWIYKYYEIGFSQYKLENTSKT